VPLESASIRPSVRRLLARLTIGASVIGAVIAVLTTARASQVQPTAPPPPVVEAAPAEPQLPAPIARLGYRHGHPHMIDVVRLEPNAVEVEVATARAFLTMQAAAAKDGIDLRIESGFRTAEEQLELFRAWRRGRGNKAARPGQSNHQSGRALDIVVNGRTFEWLEANAATFRFKRTVKGEPWHWEYVDAPIARDPTVRFAKIKKTKANVRYVKRAAKRPGANGTRRVATLER
jgi:hypothetical protein